MCRSESIAMEDLQQRIRELEAECDKLRDLRLAERAGRTAAEKELRKALECKNEESGYHLKPVGKVKSCFKERWGTPRQGRLVPGARAIIELNNTVSPDCLQNLQEFSHIWVVFVFHQNTNVRKLAKGRMPKAKIVPPRRGQPVGVFSTRTPHRPNPIGLSVVAVDKIEGKSLHISGHDLVDGTPVLDIKPYVPNDAVRGAQCPEWVNYEQLRKPADVAFESRALSDILQLRDKLELYDSIEDLVQAAKEVVAQDIRGINQKKDMATSIYECRIDTIVFKFYITERGMTICGAGLAETLKT